MGIKKRTTVERKFYSLAEVADMLGCSSATVESMRYDGSLPTVKIGHLIRVPASALDGMIDKAV